MATTASGYPYVLPADHPKEYPAASQALANKLEAMGSFMRAVRTADTAALPSGVSEVQMQSAAGSRGTDLTLTSGWLQAAVAGSYMLGAALTVSSVPAGLITVSIYIYRGASPQGGHAVGAVTSGAGGWVTLGGSFPWTLAAGDNVRVAVAPTGAGAVVKAQSLLWGQRFA